MPTRSSHPLTFDFESARVGRSWVCHADCLDWLRRVPDVRRVPDRSQPVLSLRKNNQDFTMSRNTGTPKKLATWQLPKKKGHLAEELATRIAHEAPPSVQ